MQMAQLWLEWEIVASPSKSFNIRCVQRILLNSYVSVLTTCFRSIAKIRWLRKNRKLDDGAFEPRLRKKYIRNKQDDEI